MNQRDKTLERLVKQHANGEPLSTTVNVDGRAVQTRRLLESYRFDRRAASPAMIAHISAIEHPLMCEAALSLL
jgi:hypothetical protein